METMQTFYSRLSSTETHQDVYLSYLRKLTQLEHNQLTALKSLLWWNGWGIAEE